MIAIKKCPYCRDAWPYIMEDGKYKVNCLCGFAYKKTPKCADRESVEAVWNDIVIEETKKLIESMSEEERKEWEKRNFLNWFYSNINFLEDYNGDEK